jgi:hypothetical protein
MTAKTTGCDIQILICFVLDAAAKYNKINTATKILTGETKNQAGLTFIVLKFVYFHYQMRQFKTQANS